MISAMDTYVRFALMNYENGGLTGVSDDDLSLERGRWDLNGLRDSFLSMPFAPDVICINEAKEWDMWGGRALRTVTRMLGSMFEQPYVGEVGWSPLGKFGPALLYNPNSVHLDYWGNVDPTVPWDKRNLARFRLHRRLEMKFQVLLDHWPFWSGEARTERAKFIGKLGESRHKVVWLGDFNSTASGPHWPQRAWSVLSPADAHHKGRLRADGRFDADTAALDYLIGSWTEQGRVNGVGFHAIPELAWLQGMAADKVLIPTVNDGIDAGGGLLIDFAVVNDSWRHGLVPDTFHIHVPDGSTREDFPSDHRRSGWVLDVAA